MKRNMISLFGVILIGFPMTVGAPPSSGIQALCYHIQESCEPIEDPDPAQCANGLVSIYDTSCTGEDMDGDRTANFEDIDMDGDGLADLTEFFSLGTSPTQADTDGDGHCDGTRDVCRGNGGVCRGEITDFILCESPDDLADPCPTNPAIDGATLETYSNCQIIQVVEVVDERVIERETVIVIDPDYDNDGVCDQSSFVNESGVFLHPVSGEQICTLFNGAADNCPYDANPDQSDVCNRSDSENTSSTQNQSGSGDQSASGSEDPSPSDSSNQGGYANPDLDANISMGRAGGCSLIPFAASRHGF